MSQYTPPIRDMQFVLHEMLNAEATFKSIPAFEEIDADTVNQIIEEGGKFCAEVLQPLNAVGDSEGCTLNKADHSLKTPTGFKRSVPAVRGSWLGLAELRPQLWWSRFASDCEPGFL